MSSQATTLQFGSPGKSRWEEYVCPGYPHCENFDCDLCDNPSETEGEDYMDWHAKEDEMLNTAPFGTGQYLRNEVRAYHLGRKRKEANDAKLGKGKGRSGGRAAPSEAHGDGFIGPPVSNERFVGIRKNSAERPWPSPWPKPP